jgi:membrane-bound serine protease (ClpP class)
MVLSNVFSGRAGARAPRRFGGVSLCLVGLVLLAADSERPLDGDQSKPAAPVAQSGRLIRVPLPLVGDADSRVKRAVQKVLAELPADPRPVLVFEFSSADNQSGQGSDFSRALALARYLSSREASVAKTVAFIPKTLKGHAVLVAMACEEIVMAPDAQIGEAGLDEPAEEPIESTVRSGYREIAKRRRTIPVPVALGMLDKNLEVLKVETEVSPEFVLASDLDELKQKHTIQPQKTKTLSKPGQLARFSGREARELGFATHLAGDRASLAKALSLPARLLEDDPSLAGEWRAVRVSVKGPITPQVVSRTQRMIEDQLRRNANFICLWIDSQGGSLADAMNLANFLARLDPAVVRTVAYVPAEARSDAALVAVACDQLVMGREAILGGPGPEEFSADELLLARETIRDSLGARKAHTWSLRDALIDPGLNVFRYTHQRDGVVEFFSEEELAAQADPNGWVRGDEVTRPGLPLQLTGQQAVDLGLARHTVDDFTALRQLYSLQDDLAIAEPGWADYLIDALAAPAVAWLLLLIGGAALYVELQAPGIGVGGFVAGVCFLLYFWSKHLGGTADWLEVVLFLAGVCCILLEMFVLPGVAIFGLGGGLLVIASLILASQTFVLPHNQYQLSQLRDSLLGLIGVAAGVIVFGMVMRRWLPRTALFSHMVLEPPNFEEAEDLAHREALIDLSHLLGHQGLATTQLTPSGKARFGGQLVDVIADGEVISRGARVVVVAVQGSRVVVRSVSGNV